MLLSVNLRGLEQLVEYPNREITVVERLEYSLSQLCEEAKVMQSSDIDLICRQLTFIREEKQRICGRRSLLTEAHETLTHARISFDEKLSEAKQKLKD